MKPSDRTHENHSQQARRLRCPTCKQIVKSPEQDPSAQMKFFPFCSERCKLIDLGAWFDADYRIPSRPDEESEGSSQDNSSTS
ncbi:MAG: DNA gyrase inhibitor YacG [Planctomycetaceae bacterium]|nr:MAG: DNA gyrase inhibitor YacG [Planctomycetaceae bacterium]